MPKRTCFAGAPSPSRSQELAVLVARLAPQLLAETGRGVITAAKLIGEIAGVDRFTSDAQLARLAGCAPVPVSSGSTDRYRLDRGGNRRLNHAIHMLALSRHREADGNHHQARRRDALTKRLHERPASPATTDAGA